MTMLVRKVGTLCFLPRPGEIAFEPCGAPSIKPSILRAEAVVALYISSCFRLEKSGAMPKQEHSALNCCNERRKRKKLIETKTCARKRKRFEMWKCRNNGTKPYSSEDTGRAPKVVLGNNNYG